MFVKLLSSRLPDGVMPEVSLVVLLSLRGLIIVMWPTFISGNKFSRLLHWVMSEHMSHSATDQCKATVEGRCRRYCGTHSAVLWIPHPLIRVSDRTGQDHRSLYRKMIFVACLKE